jgi:hypothetical protein
VPADCAASGADNGAESETAAKRDTEQTMRCARMLRLVREGG